MHVGTKYIYLLYRYCRFAKWWLVVRCYYCELHKEEQLSNDSMYLNFVLCSCLEKLDSCCSRWWIKSMGDTEGKRKAYWHCFSRSRAPQYVWLMSSYHDNGTRVPQKYSSYKYTLTLCTIFGISNILVHSISWDGMDEKEVDVWTCFLMCYMQWCLLEILLVWSLSACCEVLLIFFPSPLGKMN